MRARHRDYFTSKAAELTRHHQGGHDSRIERRIELANLRAAFGWSLETADIKRALELTSSLQLLWLTRGLVTEGLAWLDAALSGVPDDQTMRLARARALADKAAARLRRSARGCRRGR